MIFRIGLPPLPRHLQPRIRDVSRGYASILMEIVDIAANVEVETEVETATPRQAHPPAGHRPAPPPHLSAPGRVMWFGFLITFVAKALL